MATPRLGLVVEDKPTELSCVRASLGQLKMAYMYLVRFRSSTCLYPRQCHDQRGVLVDVEGGSL